MTRSFVRIRQILKSQDRDAASAEMMKWSSGVGLVLYFSADGPSRTATFGAKLLAAKSPAQDVSNNARHVQTCEANLCCIWKLQYLKATLRETDSSTSIVNGIKRVGFRQIRVAIFVTMW